MKRILLITSVLMMLASCDDPNVPTKSTTHKIGWNGTDLEVIELEGCEYYFTEYGKSAIMCHKGNCSNPMHKQ